MINFNKSFKIEEPIELKFICLIRDKTDFKLQLMACDTINVGRFTKETGKCYQQPGLRTKKLPTPPGGLEPPTFRLTAERANRLRHGGWRGSDNYSILKKNLYSERPDTISQSILLEFKDILKKSNCLESCANIIQLKCGEDVYTL
uniref:Uncharacterized protein n=1 Tax=Strongyloides venezuelensis TaxID=75913 RepID=A0A0K0G5Q7_STRVS